MGSCQRDRFSASSKKKGIDLRYDGAVCHHHTLAWMTSIGNRIDFTNTILIADHCHLATLVSFSLSKYPWGRRHVGPEIPLATGGVFSPQAVPRPPPTLPQHETVCDSILGAKRSLQDTDHSNSSLAEFSTLEGICIAAAIKIPPQAIWT